MIALPNELPMVTWHKQRSIPLSEGWLAESLAYSAERAGVHSWEWSGDIARAIGHYLREEYKAGAISPDELRTIISRSLQGIGYPEIASQADLVAPRVSIYLPDLANRTNHEMLFFQQLGVRLEEAVQVVVRGIRLEGVRHCVKILGNSKKWHKRCQQLSDEIVVYTRQQLASLDSPPVELAIY